MSTVDEMNENGISIGDACKYSGINRITYYYRKNNDSEEREKCQFKEYSVEFKNLFLTPRNHKQY